VTVSWKKPVNTNGVIIKYLLIIKQAGKCVRQISLECQDCTSPCSNTTSDQVCRFSCSPFLSTLDNET
jgi:hypothetical protein